MEVGEGEERASCLIILLQTRKQSRRVTMLMLRSQILPANTEPGTFSPITWMGS